MTGEVYQALAMRTKVSLPDQPKEEHLKNAAMGMAIEAGETLQHIQRMCYCGKELDLQKVVNECGDVLWYIAYLLDTLGVSIEDCMELNIRKLEGRYPERINPTSN